MMKKMITTIVSLALAGMLMFVLTGCSIDIHTGGENSRTYHIDLGDMDLGKLDFGALGESLENVNWEEIRSEVEAGIDESADDLSGTVDDTVSSLEDLLKNLPSSAEESEMINSLFEEFMGSSGGSSTDNEVPQEPETEVPAPSDGSTDLSYEEAMGLLKELLEEQGYGEYYDMIADQIKKDPGWIDSMINEEGSENFFDMFGISGTDIEESGAGADDLFSDPELVSPFSVSPKGAG